MADKSCRLRCGCNDESMLHMIECPHVQPIFRKCLETARRLFGEQQHRDLNRAVVLGERSPGTLLLEPTRALLRHALGRLYEALTKKDTNNRAFRWQAVYYRTLLALRQAAMRKAHGMRIMYANRCYTPLTETVSQNDRNKLGTVILIGEDGGSAIQADYLQELNNAARAAGSRTRHNSHN